MTDAELISAAVKASGLSVRRFAREVLVRDPRTVWRWLAGENPLPRSVREKCEELTGRPDDDPVTRDPVELTGGSHDDPVP